jgi:NSS family neurotransmitter:Na+ symporter
VPACQRVKGSRAAFWGWISVLSCLTIGAFYVVLTGYSVIYFVHAVLGNIQEDTATFFRHDVLHLTSSLSETGSLVPGLFFSTLAVLALTYCVNRKPISKGVEKACSYFMPLLGALAVLGAVSVSLLPGAWSGIMRLFYPQMDVIADAALWRDVFGQLFFSYSLGLGIVVGYSAHAGHQINLFRAMTWVALGDFAISLFSAIVIFGFIGAVSTAQGVSFESWMSTNSTFEIGFVVYPKLLQTFAPQWGSLLQMILFFCLFVAGITGVFSIVESICGNFQWRLGLSRSKTTLMACLLLLAGATPFCFGFGPHLIDALAPLVLGINMLLGACALIWIFASHAHILGPHPLFQSGRLRRYLLVVALPWALISLALSLYHEGIRPVDLSTWVRLSWLLVAVLLALRLSRKPKGA